MADGENLRTRPELCDTCQGGVRGYCDTYPVTCIDQQEMWDEGFRAAISRVRELLHQAEPK